jgi:hypothetical protein
MEITNGSCLYHVGKIVAKAQEYNLYLCTTEEGRECLLQIAADKGQNGALERAAFVLGELKQRSDALEEEYESVKKDPEAMLNYDLGFPEIVDSFVCSEQGNRRINILVFRNITEVGTMVPIIGITQKDHLRVDLRTSAWIMGKLLKLLVFAHSSGIAVGRVTGNNILIEPDRHYVLFFDWSLAHLFAGEVPEETRRGEISEAAKSVIVVLGGNMERGDFPDDGDECFYQYTSHLLLLAGGRERSAERAHAQFYRLIDEFWKREYYPFTTHPLF